MQAVPAPSRDRHHDHEVAKDVGKASRRKRRVPSEPGRTPGKPSSGAQGATAAKGARREGPQAPEPGASNGGAGGVLEALQGALAARDEAERQLRASVELARAAGESWHAIAVALGMTAEGARQRYSVRVTPSP